ncbi:hypothetical protein PG991_005449 [Apiospora marii]|uniref:Uncharacterized protein n=1 Tax=Apiospora marii TaxID=335849 RepID=A0ABR1SAM3_9PEZI
MQVVSIGALAAALVGLLLNPIKVVGAESPIPGYGVDILQWKVEVAPGQTEVLNGTVQQVYQQILHINPKFQLGDTHLRSRGVQPQRRTPIHCNIWETGFRWALQDGINYLRGVGGVPSNGPGPGNFGQVSCSWSSAIWWCNDSPSPKTLGSWDMIADSAQVILDSCFPIDDTIAGQNFESGNWSTIARGNDC